MDYLYEFWTKINHHTSKKLKLFSNSKKLLNHKIAEASSLLTCIHLLVLFFLNHYIVFISPPFWFFKTLGSSFK